MSGKVNWAANDYRRKKAQGQLVGVDSEEKNPLRALFKEDGERNKRLTHYLEHGPRGERDVELILDGRLGEVLPSGQTRRERDAWLRGLLDSSE